MDAIESISEITSALPMQGRSSEPTELSVKNFEALMARSEGQMPTQAVSPTGADRIDGINSLTKFLAAEEAALRDLDAGLHRHSIESPQMSTAELMARSLEMSTMLTMHTATLTITTGIGEGANKSLQTLFKNQ